MPAAQDNATDPGLLRARENISELKRATRKEKATLKDYEDRLATGRGGFPEDGLRHGIKRCLHNLQVFRDAILKERGNMRQMEGQQKIREEMAKLREGVEIPVEYVKEDEGEGVGGGGDGEVLH